MKGTTKRHSTGYVIVVQQSHADFATTPVPFGGPLHPSRRVFFVDCPVFTP